LAELFEEHAPLVLGLCRGLLRDATEAEDAAQQTFLSAYRSLLAGTAPREPAAWLATIARNECRTRARDRMREPLPLAWTEDIAADPFAETVRAADVASLRRALAQLPGQQRRAFLLREFSGLTYGELAVALGVSEPAIESLLFRARQQLRGSLRGVLAPVNAGLSLPLFLRDLVRRVLGSGDAASAGTLAKLGSAPVAAKVAASTAGVALVGAGAVSLTPHRHARRTVRHAPSPAARRLETKPSAKPAKLQRPVRHLSRSAVAGAWHRPRHEDAAAAEPEREQGAAPRERESEPRVQEREGGGGGAGPEAAKPEETQTGESGRDATRSAGSGSGETAQESQESSGSGSGDSAVGESSGSGDNSGSSDSADSGTGD
jgi:RNA polymerase sigma-70 factor (ECF subfamily)